MINGMKAYDSTEKGKIIQPPPRNNYLSTNHNYTQLTKNILVFLSKLYYDVYSLASLFIKEGKKWLTKFQMHALAVAPAQQIARLERFLRGILISKSMQILVWIVEHVLLLVLQARLLPSDNESNNKMAALQQPFFIFHLSVPRGQKASRLMTDDSEVLC